MSRYKKTKEEWPMRTIQGMVPKSYFTKLKKLSIEQKTPLTHLVARALKNEFDCGNPFEYKQPDIKKITNEEGDAVLTVDSHTLFNYIRKHPQLSLEQHIMLKEDMGFNGSDDQLKSAYGLLLGLEVVEEYYPAGAHTNFPENYRRVRVKGLNEKKIRNKKIPGPKYKALDYEKSPLHEVDDET
jgi:hypothetical protein